MWMSGFKWCRILFPGKNLLQACSHTEVMVWAALRPGRDRSSITHLCTGSSWGKKTTQ